MEIDEDENTISQ